MPASDPFTLREPLAAIMREAGELARATARTEFKRWTKGADNSPVSEGDIAVNDLLRARLPALAPDAGWVSEETEIVPGGTALPSVWIVDPIDGTRAYLAGRADWTVSVALAEAGRPVLAALYAPVTDEMFLAVRGRGATLNNRGINISTGEDLEGAKIAGPRRTLERLGEMKTAIAPQPKVHSLALRLARVAQGDLDAAFASKGSHDWDLAAADLLVHEAGGVMTDFAGQSLRYDRPHLTHGALFAAGAARHKILAALARDLMPELA